MSKRKYCFYCEREVTKGEGFYMTVKVVNKQLPLIRAKYRATMCDKCGWELHEELKRGRSEKDENA